MTQEVDNNKSTDKEESQDKKEFRKNLRKRSTYIQILKIQNLLSDKIIIFYKKKRRSLLNRISYKTDYNNIGDVPINP